MVASQPNFQLQDAIYRLLQERPEWRPYLEQMVAWERANPPLHVWSGWEWQAVHTPISIINSLITMGVVDLKSKSRTYTTYRLAALEDTEEALAALQAAPVGAPESVKVDDLFSLVVGHQKVKSLLRYAVLAEKPVHCLLHGVPGTAKTLMLSDIGRLPGAEFYVGSTTTKSGLVGLLLQVQPRFLVIDELDKMDNHDMSPLLNLMETGMVTRLQHGHQERVEMETKVFAGANDLKFISAPILNRFARFEIPAYTPREFVEVARGVLVQREGQGPEMALLIATEVVKYSTDIRDAVRVSRMARGDPHLVLSVVDCLWPKGGHIMSFQGTKR